MKKIKVNIKRNGVALPVYKTEQSAGCDLINNGNKLTLYPGKRAFIQTGIFIELPKGYEAQVRGRSGLNKNFGIVVPVGTVDSDYRGEIGVVVYNLSDRPYVIDRGERIAQLVINSVVQAKWRLTDILKTSDRGTGGFGSTGKK